MRRDKRAIKTRAGSPRKLGDAVTQLLSRRGYGQLETTEQVMEAWREVSVELAKYTWPGNVRRGVLEVTVKDSTILQELTFRKSQLIRSLQQRVPEAKIRDVRFRVGAIDG